MHPRVSATRGTSSGAVRSGQPRYESAMIPKQASSGVQTGALLLKLPCSICKVDQNLPHRLYRPLVIDQKYSGIRTG
ncbi:uncharacterized protein BP01DRAFT_106043 [Aspergillus saccharolyticus JOP 1030-1]|uniref:Uncharacterized protein n=1 Tax=Aspergillus saccharolyticus JOP 1030-1 TaxID=1450539 RepID=A0A318ZA93_9EURO|nr:hypothetical protein BP01DRAFT_106043 [Aspergillus saccharolyticus JOP 1030-1]PYH43244.1 hypothetical protein BP01DRAFT_106043 [Aspergillus saccharolyticus JOP 1030-1]